ncbi:ricin-type beta-trefoil lectin domain protein [Actinacidiphila bryophytorum]|uniref:Ricin-type beta-trefoil lectin domain protein n=1 Tax=Actinacidiphila bryophytorum TaxID=1436133 RepID=A0A9W4E4U9_9ACTN|nr:RICIN domain-containing protein [Actinacidiphila bryophytorum]CAG7612479.1 Ricin-type beta-trefoil lectin domain protein [Actinacidiphila bryophytorum]
MPPTRTGRAGARRRTWTALGAAFSTAAALTVSLASASPAAAATSQFTGAGSGRCLDVTGNTDTLGSLLEIWDCNGQPNQQFEATSAGELRTFNGTRCLDAYDNGTSPGTAVDIWSCNGQQNQKWQVNSNGTITGVQSGLCLDVDHAGTANGTRVTLWTCNGQSNQRWTSGGSSGTGSTLVVDASSVVRPVTHVGSGTLDGLKDETTPPASVVVPLHLNQIRQAPPGTQHRPNGYPVPVGDAMKVSATAMQAGAKMTVNMADYLDGFPYNWPGWTGWLADVDSMTAAVKARPDVTNINAFEPWNEPDWTWPSAAGSFTDGWTRTVQQVRKTLPDMPILGPSISYLNLDWMRNFLTAAKASGTLPDVICWHELGGWKNVTNDVQAYRSLEQQLGISARPISIDEYATTSEIDVPSSTNHYVAQFERDGVRDAERAFWYEAGTLNGLLYNNQPTASYWMYKWYGDQTGNVVKVTPTQNQDGVAAYDSGQKTFSLVFGGESGSNTVKVSGLGAMGSSVTATLRYVPGSGRTTNVASATTLSSAAYPVTDGTVTFPVPDEDPSGAYQLVLTPR